MEKICEFNTARIFYEDFVVVELIRMLEIQDIMKMRWLSKGIRDSIDSENYQLFQKMRDFLFIPSTFDSSDLVSKENIFQVFRKVIETKKEEPIDLNPFAYYTDGGVDTNGSFYFLQNVWKKTGTWYWTTAYSNIHVQSIISKI